MSDNESQDVGDRSAGELDPRVTRLVEDVQALNQRVTSVETGNQEIRSNMESMSKDFDARWTALDSKMDKLTALVTEGFSRQAGDRPSRQGSLSSEGQQTEQKSPQEMTPPAHQEISREQHPPAQDNSLTPETRPRDTSRSRLMAPQDGTSRWDPWDPYGVEYTPDSMQQLGYNPQMGYPPVSHGQYPYAPPPLTHQPVMQSMRTQGNQDVRDPPLPGQDMRGPPPRMDMRGPPSAPVNRKIMPNMRGPPQADGQDASRPPVTTQGGATGLQGMQRLPVPWDPRTPPVSAAVMGDRNLVSTRDPEANRKSRQRTKRNPRPRDIASSDPNWRKKANATPNVSCLSSSASSEADSEEEQQPRKAPPAAKLPYFEGKTGEWATFIFLFREMARIGKWTQREKYDRLFGALRGKAITYVYSRPRGERSDYYTLRNSLNQRYGLTELPSTARRHLQTMRQEEAETLEDFADRVLQKAVEGFPDMPEEYIQVLATETFLRGCKDKTVAYAASERKPVNVYEAMQEMRDAGANLKLFGRASNLVARQVTFRDSDDDEKRKRHDLSEEQKELLGLLKTFLASTRTEKSGNQAVATSPIRPTPYAARSRSPSPMRCYKCQEVGHAARDCKKIPICFRCGRSGHISTECRSGSRTPPSSPRQQRPGSPSTAGSN